MIDLNEKLTVTLTAGQWNALQSKIMDAAFQAAVAVNNQLMAQQNRLELQQTQKQHARAVKRNGKAEPAHVREVTPEFHIPDVAE